MNTLKAPLSKNDLRCLFNEYVEEVTKNHFYIAAERRRPPISIGG